MKQNQYSNADGIDQLMHSYPHLRVAYIDNIRLNRAGASPFIHHKLIDSHGLNVPLKYTVSSTIQLL